MTVLQLPAAQAAERAAHPRGENIMEKLTTLSQICTKKHVPSCHTLFLLHKQPSVVMSVLERQELDRQLDSAKTELFAEQRRAREQLESMQEVLCHSFSTSTDSLLSL